MSNQIRRNKNHHSAVIPFDQCSFGLSVSPEGLSKKRTKVATNNPHLAAELAMAQCTGDHQHVPLENGLPGKAQHYPDALCEVIANTTKQITSGAPVMTFFEDDHQEERLEDEVPEEPNLRQAEQPVTESQKRLVTKVHVNTGHPPPDQFLRMLKAAGCLDNVLKWAKEEFKCDQCSQKTRPSNRRRAHCPRSFSFNKVVSIDVFYINFLNLKVPILNMVCTGTNFQVAQRIPIPEGSRGGTPLSQTAWRAFLDSWIRFLGSPTMIITDSGNEFKGRFERGCESMGILQHCTTPECPWENAKAERHGGWLKQKLDKEIMSGQCTMTSLEELDEFLSGLTSAKNRWFNRGGYTPMSLVFGELPRLPGELLSDDHPGLCGLDDALQDPLGVDEASREYRKRHEIREKAREAAMSQTSKEAVQRAVRSATHQQVHWAPGQWVYCFRRGRPQQELHPRDRWVGPGVVLLSNNRVVYVAMRSRLWRCSPEQLRPALPAEILGKEIASDPGLSELLRQVTSGIRTGAVDVVREGSPPGDQHCAPVERTEGVGEVEMQDPDGQRLRQPQRNPIDEPTGAPLVTPMVPPGIIRIESSGHRRPSDTPSLPQALPQASAGPSRQSTEEEPASEPPAIGLPPGLEPIAEEPDSPSRGALQRERSMSRQHHQQVIHRPLKSLERQVLLWTDWWREFRGLLQLQLKILEVLQFFKELPNLVL